MKVHVILFMLFWIIVSSVSADVRFNSELVIVDTIAGAKFLGEVINDTDSPIKEVKVTKTSKDSEGNIIDVSDTYVDGYTNPEDGYSDDYIPVGGIVPFWTFADTDADKIISTTHVINYETTKAVFKNPDQVVVSGDINSVESTFGLQYYGEIANNSLVNIYWVSIIFVFKDGNGNLIDVEETYIRGSDYITQSGSYNLHSIYPGDVAPFELSSLLDKSEISEYYTIINYWIGGEEEYYHEGHDDVILNGDINKIKYNDLPKFTGEIKNNTDRDIYFVEVTIISRDEDGKIIDISYDDVSGTNYNYYSDYTTDSHISPGETASFEIDSYTDFDSVASFEYIINYEFSEETTSVQENKPLPVSLLGNYPNPFNPQTTIEFTVEDNSNIELSVYNSTGQKIDVLIDGYVHAGKHFRIWDASGLPSGLYFYTLKTNHCVVSKKMILVR